MYLVQKHPSTPCISSAHGMAEAYHQVVETLVLGDWSALDDAAVQRVIQQLLSVKAQCLAQSLEKIMADIDHILITLYLIRARMQHQDLEERMVLYNSLLEIQKPLLSVRTTLTQLPHPGFPRATTMFQEEPEITEKEREKDEVTIQQSTKAFRFTLEQAEYLYNEYQSHPTHFTIARLAKAFGCEEKTVQNKIYTMNKKRKQAGETKTAAQEQEDH